MGEMRRAIAREVEERRMQDRFSSTLVIAAAIIAAVRLARDDISEPTPPIKGDKPCRPDSPRNLLLLGMQM